MRSDSIPIIFGIKLKELREQAGLSATDLAQRAGLSVSYLTEIEKGRKYPKTEKIFQLAEALDTSFDDLVSLKLGQRLNPLATLLDSPMFRDLPLRLFGISQSDIFELMTRAPVEVATLVQTLVELARGYDMGVEQFFHALLRSYQQAHDNYFDDLETLARECAQELAIGPGGSGLARLCEVLEREYGVQVLADGLAGQPELAGVRAVLSAEPERLLLNPALEPSQRAFQAARELAFRRLKVKERSRVSPPPHAESFDEVLNDFRASYVASAIVLPEQPMVEALRGFFALPQWDPQAFAQLIAERGVSAEMLFYRMSQLIPRHLGLGQIHFLRFSEPLADNYHLTKQLNLSGVLIPTGIGLHEHYCRRWLSIQVLRDLQRQRTEGDGDAPVIGAQISNFMNSDAQFFCIAAAVPQTLNPAAGISLTLGFRVTPQLRRKVKFLDDPAIARDNLNETCERCPSSPAECAQRAAAPMLAQAKAREAERERTLQRLIAGGPAALADSA